MDLCILSRNGIEYKRENVLKYIKKESKELARDMNEDSSIVYFNFEKYKVGNGGFDGDGYKDLCCDLGNEAIRNGFYLVKNGYKERKPYYCQEFTCNRYQVYSGDLKKMIPAVYRGVKFNNNRSLCREGGKSMPRMTSTLRPLCKENRCKFCFYVGCDELGFLIASGGQNTHCHHPMLVSEEISFPTRLLSKQDVSLICDLAKSSVNMGVGVNLVKHRTGKVIDRSKVRWLSGICDRFQNVHNQANIDSTEKMTSYLCSKKYDYMILYHDSEKEMLFNAVNHNLNLSHQVHLPPEEHDSCSEFAKECRVNFDVKRSEKLLMGLAWIIPRERHYLNLFPEVIFVDVIVDVNKDKRPLLTATGKDANGQMFTFLRAFLPNEKQWAFRWIFSHVFPKSFNSSILDRVKVIVSDGCVQEFSQIDDAINICFPNATRIRCGFHIVTLGWKTKVISKKSLGSSVEKFAVFYDTVVRHLQSWIYSWMTSACETKEEYSVSKLMFFKFLNTQQIRSNLGEQFIESVENFVRCHIEPHETHYCFYLRKRIRHFDEYVNSVHEGTNNKIRNSALSCGPSTLIEKSLIILNENAELDMNGKIQKWSKNFRGTKLYAELKCAQFLVPHGYWILQTSWKRRVLYDSCRVSKNTWMVLYDSAKEDFIENDKSSKNKKGRKKSSKLLTAVEGNKKCSIIPRFARVRKVTLTDNVLRCSCCYRDRYGIDCAHVYHVVSSFNNYTEPSHHDCSVRWWSSFTQYGHYGNTSETVNENNLMKTFQALLTSDLIGLPIRSASPENIPIEEIKNIPSKFRKIVQNKFPVCKNFPNLRVNAADINNMQHSVSGLSQDVMSFQECNEASILSLRDNTKKSQRSVYAELMPYFKELTCHMEEDYNRSEMDDVKKMFIQRTGYFKAKAYKRSMKKYSKEKNMSKNESEKNTERKREYVSCSIPTSKKRKAHGTKY